MASPGGSVQEPNQCNVLPAHPTYLLIYQTENWPTSHPLRERMLGLTSTETSYGLLGTGTHLGKNVGLNIPETSYGLLWTGTPSGKECWA